MSFFKELENLISALPEEPIKIEGPIGYQKRPVLQLCVDTRLAQPGCLFFAVAGHKLDGHDYIDQAVAKGAIAFLYTDESKIAAAAVNLENVVKIKVKDIRKALDRLASHFYDDPSRELYCMAITGTNGKTSTTYLIEHLLREVGVPTGVIGTIDHHFQDKVWAGEMTTPDPISLQKRLHEMKELGALAVAMEISSHALEQHRADSVQLDAGVFTNLTRDHLDYHSTMVEYFRSKQKLFTDLLRGSSKARKTAAVNLDSRWARRLVIPLELKLLTFGTLDADYQFRLKGVNFKVTEFTLKTPYGNFLGRLPMIGSHNVQNAIGALIACMGYFESRLTWGECHETLIKLLQALEKFSGVPGRLQAVKNSARVYTFVDYAHTPDALENVLKALGEVRKKSHSAGKIITVFGCGGDRDKGKRPLMAKIAEELSDLVIVTSDNPRTENPQQIIEDICQGFQKIKPIAIAERELAIQDAVEIANPEDVILIAGKGHEDYQIIGTQKNHFSDLEIAAKLLQLKKS